jgi:hypothetical protein
MTLYNVRSRIQCLTSKLLIWESLKLIPEWKALLSVERSCPKTRSLSVILLSKGTRHYPLYTHLKSSIAKDHVRKERGDHSATHFSPRTWRGKLSELIFTRPSNEFCSRNQRWPRKVGKSLLWVRLTWNICSRSRIISKELKLFKLENSRSLNLALHLTNRSESKGNSLRYRSWQI